MLENWSRGKGVAYHVYPEHEDVAIRDKGVVPGYHGMQYDKQPRVFVFTDLGEARWYARVQEQDAASEGVRAPDGSPIRMRLAEVDITDLLTSQDDTLGLDIATTALQIVGCITADRVSLSLHTYCEQKEA